MNTGSIIVYIYIICENVYTTLYAYSVYCIHSLSLLFGLTNFLLFL